MTPFRIHWRATLLSTGLAGAALFSLVFLTPSLAPFGTQKYGPFVPRIVDGDTISSGEQTFRIAGVDTCEKGQPAKFPGYAEPINCGEYASAFVSRFIGKSEVVCYDLGQRTYGRIVARCFLDEGWPTLRNDIGAFALESGWALPTDHATISYAIAYQFKSFSARLKKNGFWNGEVENPASWRHRNQ